MFNLFNLLLRFETSEKDEVMARMSDIIGTFDENLQDIDVTSNVLTLFEYLK